MPYAFAVSEPIVKHIAGRKHVTWTVTETGDITASDEWTIAGVPTPCEITLIDWEIVAGSGGSTLAPEIGLKPSFGAAGSKYFLVAGSPAAASGRQDRITRIGGAETAVLVGQSKPNSSISGGTLVTRITIREGHAG